MADHSTIDHTGIPGVGGTSELDYVAFTAQVSITNTSEGTAHTVVTSGSIAFDGSTVAMIEFYSPDVSSPDGAAGRATFLLLYEDATLLGRIAVITNESANANRHPVHTALRRTPSNASHTFTVKAYSTVNANAFVNAGTGGTGAPVAGFIRVTVA